MVEEVILKPYNPFCYSLYVVSLLTAIFNIYGLYSMYKSSKIFCFEKYVLFSGLFEIFLIVLEIFLPDDIILNVTQTIQIAQALYITQKYMNIYVYLSYKDKENDEKIEKEIEDKIKRYNLYIKLIIVGVVLLIIGFGLIEYFDDYENAIDDYCFFAHDLLCLIICIILYIFSTKIEKLINETLNKASLECNIQSLVEKTEKDISQENEFYLTTRNKQIFLISISYLIINATEFFISVIELTVTFIYNPKKYWEKSPKKKIWEKKLDIYEFATDYACLVNTVCNFFTFYFIIRGSFQLKYVPQRKTQFLNDEDIDKNQDVLNHEKRIPTDAENFLNAD